MVWLWRKPHDCLSPWWIVAFMCSESSYILSWCGSGESHVTVCLPYLYFVLHSWAEVVSRKSWIVTTSSTQQQQQNQSLTEWKASTFAEMVLLVVPYKYQLKDKGPVMYKNHTLLMHYIVEYAVCSFLTNQWCTLVLRNKVLWKEQAHGPCIAHQMDIILYHINVLMKSSFWNNSFIVRHKKYIQHNISF